MKSHKNNTVNEDQHLTLKVGAHVWIVDHLKVVECTVSRVWGEPGSTDRLYELSSKLLPGGYVFMRLENIFTNPKMALLSAIDSAEVQMRKLETEINLRKLEYRSVVSCYKRFNKQLENLKDG